jgi:hypothetical protein
MSPTRRLAVTLVAGGRVSVELECIWRISIYGYYLSVIGVEKRI